MPAITDLVRDLHDFERHQRLAIALGGQLTARAVHAQTAAGLSPIYGHQILTAFNGATGHLGTALATTAEGHRKLEVIGRQLGLDVAAYGDDRKPPNNPAVFFTGADGSGTEVSA